MLQRVEKTKSNLLDKILQNPNANSWAMKMKQIMNHINYQQTTDESKTTMKTKVKEAVNKAFHRKINESSKEKSKTQHRDTKRNNQLDTRQKTSIHDGTQQRTS